MTARSGEKPASLDPRPPYSIVWSARARENLLEIGEYIARDKPAAAERWMALLVAATERAPMARRGTYGRGAATTSALAVNSR